MNYTIREQLHTACLIKEGEVDNNITRLWNALKTWITGRPNARENQNFIILCY
jgi:hypothetical protein